MNRPRHGGNRAGPDDSVRSALVEPMLLALALPPLVAACQSIGLIGLGFLVAAILVIEAIER